MTPAQQKERAIEFLSMLENPDPAKIEKEGQTRFAWRGASNAVQTVSDPPVQGGVLERANVNAIDEMVHLMSAYREFEAVQRSLKTMMSDMNSKLISEFGRLS